MKDNNKLYSVHFLRLLASFAVVVHHVIARYLPTLQVGAAGVDLFFIISGLVIGLSLISGEGPATFAIRRIIRIYPIYWICTIAYTIFRIWAWSVYPSPIDVAGSIIIFPVFGGAWHPIYWPAWTLEYEISFYALSVILIVTLRERAAAIGAIVLAAVALIQIPIPGSNPLQLFDLSRFLEFSAGLMLALSIKRQIFVDKPIGLLLIALSFLMLYVNYSLKYSMQTLAWGIPCLMLMIGMLSLEKERFLRNKIFKIGGDASYVIYLCHITVIELIGVLAVKFGHNPDSYNRLAAIVYSIFCIAATLTIGVVLHLLIEKPILRYLRVRYLDGRERVAFVTE